MRRTVLQQGKHTTVTVIDRGRELIENRLVLLDELKIHVGTQGRQAEALHSNSNGSATVAEVAKFVSFGTPNMPPRMYLDLATSRADALPEYIIAAVGVVQPVRTPVSLRLKPVGKALAGLVRDAIVELGAVDTGTLRNSITYEVRRGEQIMEKGKP